MEFKTLKKKKNYRDISANYNPNSRIKFFDTYRNKKVGELEEPIKVKAYVIDIDSASNETPHKIIDAHIVAVERTLGDGELLFRCICDPKDFQVIKIDEMSNKPYVKTTFHRMERFIAEVV